MRQGAATTQIEILLWQGRQLATGRGNSQLGRPGGRFLEFRARFCVFCVFFFNFTSLRFFAFILVLVLGFVLFLFSFLFLPSFKFQIELQTVARQTLVQPVPLVPAPLHSWPSLWSSLKLPWPAASAAPASAAAHNNDTPLRI